MPATLKDKGFSLFFRENTVSMEAPQYGVRTATNVFILDFE